MARRVAHDDCIKLDLCEPAVRSVIDLRRSAAGTLHWASGGVDIADAGFDWRHGARRLILRAIIDGAPMTQTIVVTTTRPHFGGVRLWFACPETGKRARALLLAPGARRWTSAASLRLAYPTQRMGAGERRLKRLIEDADSGRRRNAMRRMLRRRRVRAQGW